MDDEPREEELNRDPPTRSRCLNAYEALVGTIAEANTTWIHVDRCVIVDREKRTEKATFINYFKAKVCALRNSNGGNLLVHLDGQTRTDRCLEKFDEAVEHPLKSLITDGSLFTDNYKRQWLSAYGERHLEDFYDCIVLTVKKSATLCTTNYNSKVTSDLELEPPTLGNIHYILQQPVRTSQPVLRNHEALNESRHLQCKQYYDRVERDIDAVCQKIWKRYKLREYITAMSNVERGGSVLIGIEEIQSGSSKEYSWEGFILPKTSEANLKSALQEKLRSVVQLTNTRREFKNVSQDILKIEFSRRFERVILEISIGRREGVLFFNDGPTAYEILTEGEGTERKKKIKKMSESSWIDRLFIQL